MSSISMLVFFLILAIPVTSLAKVTGPCANCHTMHNSQGGSELPGGPKASLLANSCVGCHSDSNLPIKPLGSSSVPVVFITGGEPSDYLAGGNFWWVADQGGNDDSKGHNVLGISGVDSLTQAPGNVYGGCATDGCHGSLAKEGVPGLGSGCEGCHLRVRHHAEDRNEPVAGGYKVTTSDQGYYRFLAGHMFGEGHGVSGIEDASWQKLSEATANKHNEYLGKSGGSDAFTSLSTSSTVTAYCCGCHAEFHKTSSGSSWIRHPSDAVLPDRTPDSEYEAYTVFNPSAPVARPSLTVVSNTVYKGADMVMCLSCHRPHGSPYEDLLRWNYKDQMNAGTDGPGAGTGCFVCHTTKDGV